MTLHVQRGTFKSSVEFVEFFSFHYREYMYQLLNAVQNLNAAQLLNVAQLLNRVQLLYGTHHLYGTQLFYRGPTPL